MWLFRIKKNMNEAVKYYKLAAEQKYPNAQYQLGLCYKNGTGVSKNKLESVKYFKLAGNQGVYQL